MKGVIFDLLHVIVATDLGEDAWDDVLDAAGVDGAYTSVGSYPDAEFTSLLAHLPAAGDSTGDRLRWFGQRAMPLLAAHHPEFFDAHDELSTFLPTLSNVIHAEVRKLYPDTDVPHFDMRTASTDIVLEYRSPRRLCALAEGFILGAATFFGEHVEITQSTCMLDGDECCTLRCRTVVPAVHG